MKITVVNKEGRTVGREKNPHKRYNIPQDTGSFQNGEIDVYERANERYSQFEKFVTYYEAPGIEPGEWDVELVWQVKYGWNKYEWMDISEEYYLEYKDVPINTYQQIYRLIPKVNQPVEAKDMQLPPLIQRLADAIAKSDCKIVYGLQPGHIELIEAAIKEFGQATNYVFEKVGKQVNWEPFSLSIAYLNYLLTSKGMKTKENSYECLNCAWQSSIKPKSLRCPDCGTYIYEQKINAPNISAPAVLESKDMETSESLEEAAGFLAFVKDERARVDTELWPLWLNKSPKERVAVENLLIAYDQMAARLERFEASKDNWIRVEDVAEVLKYMCGYVGEFPDKQPGDGNFYWRKILQAKFKEIGVEMPLPNPPETLTFNTTIYEK